MDFREKSQIKNSTNKSALMNTQDFGYKLLCLLAAFIQNYYGWWIYSWRKFNGLKIETKFFSLVKDRWMFLLQIE